MIDTTLIDLLACPWCGCAPLHPLIEVGQPGDIDAGWLICPAGEHRFVIRSGIPVLLPKGIDGQLQVRGREWQQWHRKLLNFVTWRQVTYGREPASKPVGPDPDYVAFQSSFFEFCELTGDGQGSLVVDIGSAAGGIRSYLGPNRRYCGIDPLPVLPKYDHWMIQGMGEQLPFRDGIADTVLIMQTLDHCATPNRLIDEAHRVLRLGGRLCVQQVVDRPYSPVPVRKRLRRWAANLLGRERPDPSDTKMVNYTVDSLHALIAPNFGIRKQQRHPRGHAFMQAERQ